MTVRLGDLLGLHQALKARLDNEFDNRANAAAGELLWRITGKRIGDMDGLSSLNDMGYDDLSLGSYSGLGNDMNNVNTLSQDGSHLFDLIDSCNKEDK